MPGSILGTAVRRVEDPDLLLGRAQFVDDLPIDGALHLVFVRSPHAHARVDSIDTSAALGAPGEAVTLRKRRRVVRAARRWLAEHPGRARAVRFDVVAVVDDPPGVTWVKGAFDREGGA